MLDHIRETLEIMRDNELVEFELHRANLKLRLRKTARRAAAGSAATVRPVRVAANPVNAAPARAKKSGPLPVKSPLVGTFYRAHRPGGPPLVEIGQAVKKGQVLAIVEAIRLAHEIKAACNGSIVMVSADEGQAVQYGEALFEIQPE
jgi:acetyl-CoA carboxylase biotin carboxyl carrier protein